MPLWSELTFAMWKAVCFLHILPLLNLLIILILLAFSLFVHLVTLDTVELWVSKNNYSEQTEQKLNCIGSESECTVLAAHTTDQGSQSSRNSEALQ